MLVIEAIYIIKIAICNLSMIDLTRFPLRVNRSV